MKEYLEILRNQPEFLLLMKEIKSQRPLIPEYNHHDDNIEEWKANSNMLKGFRLALSFLGEDDL